MAICGTISASYARRWTRNSRPARTGGADAGFPSFRTAFCRRRSSRFAKGNFNHRQSRIAAIASSCDLDMNVRTVSGAVRDRFRQHFPTIRFVRRADSQGAKRAAFVIPTREVVQSALHGCSTHSQERQPLPELQRSKKSLDFSGEAKRGRD